MVASWVARCPWGGKTIAAYQSYIGPSYNVVRARSTDRLSPAAKRRINRHNGACLLCVMFLYSCISQFKQHCVLSHCQHCFPIAENNLERTLKPGFSIRSPHKSLITSYCTAAMRDISASINSLAHRALLAEDVLFISDSIGKMSHQEKESFRDKYKLNTIVDTESDLKPQNSGTNDVFGQWNPSSNLGTCHLLDLTYCWIELRSGEYTKRVMQRLSIWSRWYVRTQTSHDTLPS